MIAPDGNYGRDFRWQLQFAKAIGRRVGPYLIGAAPLHLDKSEATDFMMFDARDKRIAARVRRPNLKRAFWKDMTFRCWRATGARTEWAKVIEDGFAQWMFYARHTGHFRDLDPWYLIDLDVLRDLYNKHGDAILFERHKVNPDGKTAFHVIRPGDIARKYAREFLIAWEFDGQRDQTTLFKGAA